MKTYAEIKNVIRTVGSDDQKNFIQFREGFFPIRPVYAADGYTKEHSPGWPRIMIRQAFAARSLGYDDYVVEILLADALELALEEMFPNETVQYNANIPYVEYLGCLPDSYGTGANTIIAEQPGFRQLVDRNCYKGAGTWRQYQTGIAGLHVSLCPTEFRDTHVLELSIAEGESGWWACMWVGVRGVLS